MLSPSRLLFALSTTAVYLSMKLCSTGKSPSWNLSRVMVHDLNADRKYLFINDNVIAVEEGDGSLERTIAIAGPEEMKSFNHLFYSTTQRNITDKHIWFSIFIRPAKSRFTRVQRLSCCLTLLYFTMLSSMMFYEIGGAQSSADATYHLGPFAFAPAQIGIGVMTTLIIFPINILIVGELLIVSIVTIYLLINNSFSVGIYFYMASIPFQERIHCQ